MKKFLSILLAFVTALSICAIAACTKGPSTPSDGDNGDTPTGIIKLRSEDEQKMQVGDMYKLVYDASYDGKKVQNSVDFKSSDESVVTVDAYGNISAVGAGTATVTLSLKQDSKVTAKVTCKVTKPFFMVKLGYYAGNVDPTTADVDGWVHILPGEQTQILVSEYSENWYFKTTIEHSGDTGADSSGRWGIGSFLVDETNSIGNVMAWFGFQPTDHANKKFTPYVGGWRVQTSNMDKEIQITSAPFENASTADFEVIRNGVDMYCTVTVGTQVAKYIYSCPSLAGKATYPGVYSQRQELYVSDFEATSDETEVMSKLKNFQNAENVVIGGISSSLYADETYNLVATVLPDTTYDKGVKFSLKNTVEGVSIAPEGKLTIAAGVTGEVTVVATADSNADAKVERTYTVKAKTTSENALIDTNAIVANSSESYSLSTDGAVLAGTEKVYLPLNAKGNKWAVTFTSTLSSVGVLSATSGMCNYVSVVVANGKVTYGAMNAKQSEIACNTKTENSITVVRDGSFYLIIVNGRLVERFYSAVGAETMPVIFSGVAGAVSGLTLKTEETEVDAIIAEYPYTVGKYVTDNGDGSYTLAQKDFGSANDINWPPVNNYENGIKFADTLTGDFTIEFKMKDFRPMGSTKVDSKVLIYLRSENKTASLQFCWKKSEKDSAIALTFCPNLNDGTWAEYTDDCLNSFNEEVTVKVVKTATNVELYINGNRVFEGNTGLNNNGFWTENTEFTPGIGTYSCGVTLSDITLTAGTNA